LTNAAIFIGTVPPAPTINTGQFMPFFM
jgi:hypothetical protein